MSYAPGPDSPATNITPGCADKKRLAFDALDAVDNLNEGLAALRAMGQLASGGETGAANLAQLQRQDLAALIGVVSSGLEARYIKARAAAALAAKTH